VYYMGDTHSNGEAAMKAFKVFGVVSKVTDKVLRKTSKTHRKSAKAERKATA